MLDQATYLLVTAHMLLWYMKWFTESTLWHNMFSTDELRISPSWVQISRRYNIHLQVNVLTEHV